MILKRCLSMLVVPAMAILFIILVFGGILTYPIYWVLTGGDKDDWVDIVLHYPSKIDKFLKAQGLISN